MPQFANDYNIKILVLYLCSAYIAVKSGNFCLRISPEAPFYWKLAYIVPRLRKSVPVLQVWGSAPTPPTPPVFRRILLISVSKVWRLFGGSVSFSKPPNFDLSYAVSLNAASIISCKSKELVIPIGKTWSRPEQPSKVGSLWFGLSTPFQSIYGRVSFILPTKQWFWNTYKISPL